MSLSEALTTTANDTVSEFTRRSATGNCKWRTCPSSLRRVARCPVFYRTVRYFGSLSVIILIVIPDNACVNSSIVCVKYTGTASIRYFGESHLATLSLRGD